MFAAHSMARGGLEGTEAPFNPAPGDVLQPNLSLCGILWKCVKAEIAVPLGVVVAARHAARKSRHAYLTLSEMFKVNFVKFGLDLFSS